MIYTGIKKNYLILFLIIFILIINIEICHANEANSTATTNPVRRVVLLELFVQANCSTCPHVEFCLEDMFWEYGSEKIILLEEHLWGDGYDIEETNNRYDWYVGESKRGTPDLFINGLNERIQGLACKDLGENYDYYKKVIDSEAVKCASIKLSAIKCISNSVIIIEGQVENISIPSFEDLAICGMVYLEGEEPGLSYLVRDIFSFQDLPLFLPGNEIDYKFISEPLITEENMGKLHAVVFVQNLVTKEVLQAVYVE
ncbi:MAG: hypothetical protein U9N03_08035 [Candidatus Caldatribacteriota bacterium]|nr:hypothetical protein [Candidatus Caldatribacteriota bacterium]